MILGAAAIVDVGVALDVAGLLAVMGFDRSALGAAGFVAVLPLVGAVGPVLGAGGVTR